MCVGSCGIRVGLLDSLLDQRIDSVQRIGSALGFVGFGGLVGGWKFGVVG